MTTSDDYKNAREEIEDSVTSGCMNGIQVLPDIVLLLRQGEANPESIEANPDFVLDLLSYNAEGRDVDHGTIPATESDSWIDPLRDRS